MPSANLTPADLARIEQLAQNYIAANGPPPTPVFSAFDNYGVALHNTIHSQFHALDPNLQIRISQIMTANGKTEITLDVLERREKIKFTIP